MAGSEVPHGFDQTNLRRKIPNIQTGILVPEDLISRPTIPEDVNSLDKEGLLQLVNDLRQTVDQQDLVIQHHLRINRLLQKRNDLLEDKRIRDPFTNLYNKEGINRMLAVYIDDAEKSKGPMSLLVIDLDKFKSINDTYGHAVGDTVLKAVSNILQTQLRKEDISISTTSQLKTSDLDLSQPYQDSEVGRFGGEEFVVGLTNCDESGSRIVADGLLKAIRALQIPDPLNPGQFLPITASIGGSTIDSLSLNLPINGPERAGRIREESSKYFQLADNAELRAKTEGRDRFVHTNDPLQPTPNATPLPNINR